MIVTENVLFDTSRAKLMKTYVQGAIIRSVFSLCMWLFALFSFWVDEIQISNFIGISCSVLFLVLIGPPTLFILKRITRKSTFANFRLFINMMDVMGYTAVIFSLGGFEATYLTPIYAALITYWGVMGPPRVPFIVAGFCAFAFGSMVALDGLGIIPSLKIDPHFNPSLVVKYIRVSVVIGLLFIVAYISSFTASKLKQGRNQLRKRNKKLEEKTIQLENALNEIKTLRGIVPICSHCKKIRDDRGYWNILESYIQKHSDASFSHGMCPECSDELYGNEDWFIEMNKNEDTK